MPNCIFCQIAKATIPSYPIWQNDKFMAILDIFPATLGQTLVISKKHYFSDFTKLPDHLLKSLIIVSKKIAKTLNSSFDTPVRTCFVLEGFDIDHIHAKLYPLGNQQTLSASLKSPAKKADPRQLRKIQQHIKALINF